MRIMTTNHSPELRHRVTNAKRVVLELLAEYFCLRTNDVARLVRNRTPNESDKRSVRYTLELLYKEGLVNRLPYIELDRDRGVATFVYGLSDKGVSFVRSIWPHAKTFDEHSQRTLDHELEISHFHFALRRLCTTRKLKLFWQQSDLKHTISPDAMFAITNPEKPEGKNTLYYFLELERAKIGHYVNGEPSIMKKLGKYHAYYGTDACQKEWTDFRQFRVIVTQRNDERRENLLKQLNKEFNHRMFWLTTEEAYKRDIGGRVFLTPKDFGAAAYGFLDI